MTSLQWLVVFAVYVVSIYIAKIIGPKRQKILIVKNSYSALLQQ